MKFKFKRQVVIGFKSGTMITIFCDKISFKEGFYDRLVFMLNDTEVCNCLFNEVGSICYFKGAFALSVTYIDKNDIIYGALVEC